MFDDVLSSVADAAEGVAIEKIRPKVVELFDDNDPSDIRNYILTDYPLVEKKLSDEHKELVAQYGSQMPQIVGQYLQSDRIYGWLADPEWVSDDEVRENLEEVAEVIDETPNGHQWLESQVQYIRNLAGVGPDGGND